jgi:hypothetical protein
MGVSSWPSCIIITLLGSSSTPSCQHQSGRRRKDIFCHLSL